MNQSKQASTFIPAGERKRIIHRVSNSIPASFHLKFEVVNKTETLAGFLEIETSAVLIDKKQKRLPLEPEMTLEASMWDAFYSVYVIPEQDIELSQSGTPAQSTRVIFIVVLVIALIAVLNFVFLSL